MLRFKFDSNVQNSQKSDNNDNEMYRIENKYKKKPLIIKFHLIIIVIIKKIMIERYYTQKDNKKEAIQYPPLVTSDNGNKNIKYNI